ncbi:Uncharacterised protein [Mycobacterium tuberculosis]|nr:Uncharacterised protein [Mycobacterium tuberculosis]
MTTAIWAIPSPMRAQASDAVLPPNLGALQPTASLISAMLMSVRPWFCPTSVCSCCDYPDAGLQMPNS